MPLYGSRVKGLETKNKEKASPQVIKPVSISTPSHNPDYNHPSEMLLLSSGKLLQRGNMWLLLQGEQGLLKTKL
ncbi:unnamed protein product [Pleuronectes platessa]|uniref:Uncharacterized protein n=1 Tax=Pleuronectes platessa TaxID=8262 RepID=A0A9N7TWB7_PLEPL|nr:unnamed protein product [Pleuronectes platessa]